MAFELGSLIPFLWTMNVTLNIRTAREYGGDSDASYGWSPQNTLKELGKESKGTVDPNKKWERSDRNCTEIN